MFCFQCQETKGGTGCTKIGVCGKNELTAQLQDLLVYVTKGISHAVVSSNVNVSEIEDINEMVISNLFVTITNANFDDAKIKERILETVKVRDEFIKKHNVAVSHNASCVNITSDNVEEECYKVSILDTKDEDIRSLRELITYGLKGGAAYIKHAYNLGHKDNDLFLFIHKALNSTLDDTLSVDDLVALTLKTGEFGVNAMALLDTANTSKYSNPVISKVNIGVRNNPAILISGHDLLDLEKLLEQTKGTGVDVYTHSEMLPANYYPFFKKYDNLVGNYGNAWWKQTEEFKTFNGAILFTTNCIVPSVNDEIKSRLFTTGEAGLSGCVHIGEDKDFSAVIEKAKKLPAPTEIETGEIVGGFAHNQVIELADSIVDAVKSGDIKKFYVMGGCDGRMKNRSYYTDFANALGDDTVILTAGCAKYRYNKLNLGDINGIPRVLDAGQCNDSYSLALIALKLKEIFGLDDINELPIVYNIAWYEQKAVIVLLALLHLGVKNIHLGPTLPAFISSNVLNVLVENFGISGIGTVEEDIAKW